jgi:hypothetical protein
MSSTSNFAGISFGWDAKNLFRNRKELICDRWARDDRVFASCNVKVSQNPYGCIVVEGQPRDPLRSKLLTMGPVYLQYWAANPPTYLTSVSGSGLPYPNPETAYENTPNVGKVRLGAAGRFRFRINFPNSYYKHLGKTLVRPHVKFLFRDSQGNMIGNIISVKIGQGIPYRSLTWPEKRNWNIGPLFFCGRESLPIRTQAQILADSGYPCVNREAPNFWGLRPPAPEG